MRKNYTSIYRSLKSNLGSLTLFLASLAGTLPSTADAQVTYTFVTAGATGTTGPTQGQVNTAYSSSNLNNLVTSTGGIQSFTITQGGPYRIIAIGAQGGYGGGHGAYVSNDYNLSIGDVLKIVVGQAGLQTSNPSGYTSGGGGGGSYVANSANVPYVVAGGGGGNGDGYQGYPASGGMDASLTQSASPYPGGGAIGSGANNGNGGQCASSGVADPGAGFNTDGDFCGATTRAIARAFLNGSTGGQGGSYGLPDPYGGDGGFGGGGGGFNSGSGQRGGGGGGYSGGQGGVAFNTPSNDAAGSGGASLLGTGTNPTASVTTRTGDGIVILQQLCDVNITASTTNSTNPSICAGTTVTLTTNAASNYSWSTGSTSTSIVVTPATTTSYTVAGTSTLGCSNEAVITITVNSTVPSLTVTGSAPATCLGNTVSITASGALTYSWSGGITNGVAFTPANGVTTYTVVGANGCGTTSATRAVTITPLPITVSASSNLICAGTGATLTPGGGTTYTWMPGATTGTAHIIAPTANTVYSVTGQTGSCVATATISIQTNPLPTMTIAASNTAICQGESVNLTVTGNALTYTWNPGGSNATSISSSPANSTAFSVSGRDGNNCLGTTTKVIIVNSAPFISVSASALEVCAGGPATLSAIGASTYTWNTTPPTVGSTVQVHPMASGIFSVDAQNAGGCHSISSISITVFEPSITVSSNTVVCLGSSTTLFADGADSYVWANNSSPTQAISVSPSANTSYTVTGMVNNQAGLICPATAVVDVTVNPLPVITASAEPSTICSGKSASLTGSGAVTYTWAGGYGVAPAITVTPFANITYTVNGTDANGCKSSGTVLVLVSPCTGINAISANNVNLVVYPNPSNGEFTISSDETITLNIVNELGQQVKVINLTSATHDVKVSNLASGVYFITGANKNGSVKQKIVIAE